MLEIIDKISKSYHHWKEEVFSLDTEESEFQKWLFIHVAGVLFGGKAGELLTLCPDQCGLDIERQIELMEALSGRWSFSCLPLNRDSGTAKVIIYNNQKVSDALSRVPPCILKDKLNYRVGVTPKQFLKEIRDRWEKTGEIPHEVGLALGYPVKDVLGYMGLLPLECMGVCGWRIYGDPAPSLNKCRKFTEAKQGAMIFLAA